MTALESITGCCWVEVTSGDVTRFLDQISQKGIHLQEVVWDNDLTIRFRVSRGSLEKLLEITKQQGAELKVLSRMGLYWDVRGFLKRPIFLFCICLMVFIGVFLPGRIFFVEVQGNSAMESARILETAAEYGVRFGASRRLVRSEQVKNQLIGAIPELEWVGVNTKGCVAVISVREKSLQEPVLPEPEPRNIIALRDGIILDCSATRGRLLCTPGQAVSEGDVLISGSASLLNVDTVTGASGEVFAATQRQIAVLTPDFAGGRGENGQGKVKFSLQIGKNLINFFKGSGISGTTCVKMYSKYVLTLPGGFSLPVALIKWTLISCDVTPERVSEDDAKALLSQFASSYLEGKMIAGRIVQKCELLAQADGIYQMTGDYACTEMIGRAQKEQIGAYHGKTD